MGVTGLLPFLKKIHEPVNVSKFAGCTVAIDAYCWLHKGAFSCAEKLALGEKTDQYVYYCMKFINNLLAKNIKPVLVFDGCHLPSKKNVEKTRREKRDMNRKKAAQFLREGRRAEARECLQRCIDISPEMALELMNMCRSKGVDCIVAPYEADAQLAYLNKIGVAQVCRSKGVDCIVAPYEADAQLAYLNKIGVAQVCRSKGVDCIVAPYEADAQLAYLNKIGVAQVIVTEDSDLLLFGCEKVLFKMDHAGNGILIERSRLNEVMELQSGHFTFDKFRYMCILSGCDYLASLSGIGLAKANKVFKLARQSDLQQSGHFTFDKFRYMCILSGCDYLASLSGIGLAKNNKVFKLARQSDLQQLLKKLSTYLKSNITVPQEYIDGFIQANNTFLHQLVYDPLRRKLVPLTPYPPDIQQEDVTYAGPHITSERAYQLALGNINIYSNEKFADYDPDTYVPKYVKKKPESLHLLSIWDKHYRIRPRPGLTEVQPSDRPVLKGKEVEVKASFRKQSPKKRLREAEDSTDVKSNSELSDLYVQQSPSKKRLKTETAGDELHRFMFADGIETSNENVEASQEQEETEDTKIKKGPKFFSSLSEAHSSIKRETDQQSNDDKENGVTSPRRNVFAFKSPSKKSRFDLNATRSEQVKSRFFAKTSKPLRLSTSLNNTPKEKIEKEEKRTEKHSLSGFKLVHENTANVTSEKSSKDAIASNYSPSESDHEVSNNLKPVNKVPDDIDLEERDNKPLQVFKESVNTRPYAQSPTSAFNWGKFKFNSKDKSNSSPSPLSSKPLSIFKRKSETNLEASNSSSNAFSKGEIKDMKRASSCSNLNESSSTNSVQDSDKRKSEDVEDEVIEIRNEESSLGSSYPYSIDTDCLPSLPEEFSLDSQSQQSINSEGMNSQSSSSSLKQKRTGLNLYFKPSAVNNSNNLTEKNDASSNDKVVDTESESQVSVGSESRNSQDSSQGMVSSQSKRKGLSIYFKPVANNANSNESKEEIDADETDEVRDIGVKATKEESDVVVIGSDSEDCERPKVNQQLMKSKPLPNKSPKSQKGKAKSGCRVSGLSKKSKTLSEQDDGKQKSLKDMFSKFAHTKSSKPKISHGVDEGQTPESETSVLNKECRIQKHLQL